MRKAPRPLSYDPPQLSYTFLGKYLLTADFWAEVGGRRFLIPAGTKTDLASTPRILWNLLPPTGIYEAAATAHDYWCAEGIAKGELTSREADAYFREMMHDAGVGFFTRWVMWAAVRVAAPHNVKRRPSGIVPDLPLVTLIGVLVAIAAYALVVGLDRLAHLVHLL